MIPEQVWDGRHPRAWPLTRASDGFGHAPGLGPRRVPQASPIDPGRPTFDQPPQTVKRSLKEKVGSDRVIWRFDNQRTQIATGDVLRVEVLAPAVVHWSRDGWKTTREIKTSVVGLGIHVADLDTKKLKSKQAIELTFFWSDTGHWEGEKLQCGSLVTARPPTH